MTDTTLLYRLTGDFFGLNRITVVDRRSFRVGCCDIERMTIHNPSKVAQPLAGSSESFHDRDQRFPSMERKWDSQQVEVLQDPAESRKDIYLITRNGMENGNTEERRMAEKQETRGRHNSLRHVKNSTEVLRQRSTRRAAKETMLDANAAAREGRQFTVASVGNNGKIYLRYAWEFQQTIDRLGKISYTAMIKLLIYHICQTNRPSSTSKAPITTIYLSIRHTLY